MKTRLILFTTLIFLATGLFSQDKPFRFGFRVAPALSWISPDSEHYESDGIAPGFSWGMIADFSIAANYFIKTGFNFDYLNGNLVFPHQKDTNTPGTLNRKYKLRYIEVPLTIKLRTNKFGKTAYFGELGLGTGFRLRAKANDEFHDSETNGITEWESDISGETAFLKESLIAGAGFEYFIDESTSILVEIVFSNSLSDILTGENTLYPDVRQNGFLYGFQLNLGIIF